MARDRRAAGTTTTPTATPRSPTGPRRVPPRVRHAESGRVAPTPPPRYALAIVFDLIDDEQQRMPPTASREIVAKAGYRISTGFVGTPLVTDALSRNGHLDAGLPAAARDRVPVVPLPGDHGRHHDLGALGLAPPDGTVNPSGMTSLNHYALGAVADWLHRVVGGLSPPSPATGACASPRTRRRGPHRDLRHSTTYGEATARLDAHVHARRRVTIPEGTTADVVLPWTPTVTSTVAAGTHEWQFEVDLRRPERRELHSRLRPGTVDDPAALAGFTDVFATHYRVSRSTVPPGGSRLRRTTCSPRSPARPTRCATTSAPSPALREVPLA